MAKDVSVVLDIDAPPERVWEILSDVDHWNEWTESITRIQRLEPGAFGNGSTAKVKQPLMPNVTWRVTAFEPGRNFTWENDALGAHTSAEHLIEPRDGGSRLTLTIKQWGGLTSIMAPLTSRFIRRYMNMEANGLKRRSEEGASTAAAPHAD